MRRKGIYTLSLSLCAALAWSFSAEWAWADLTIRETLTDSSGKRLGERRGSYTEKRARIDNLGLTVMADLEKLRIYLIDHRKKFYVEFDLQQVEAAVREAEKEMEKLIGRSRLEAAHTQVIVETKLSIVATGETRTIRGFPAQKVEVYKRRDLFLESWHSARINAREYRAFIEQAAVRSRGAYSLPREELQIFNETKDLGYPVLVKNAIRGIARILEELNEGRIPASVFLVPPGYRKVGSHEVFRRP